MMDDIATGRLAGAAFRIGRGSEEMDRQFLGRAGGSMARFIFMTGGAPAQIARKLVSQGLVSPDNPCAIALQEVDETTSAKREAWIRPEALADGGRKAAEQIIAGDADRSVRVFAAALAHRTRKPGFDHLAVAEGFEKIALDAQASGDQQSMKIASQAFAQSTISGVASRQMTREGPKRHRREADHELQ